MTQKNIFLTGFMTAGKSTVGCVLASALNGQFVDTDYLVEQRMCMDIKEIFAHFGEEYFRLCETVILEDLCLSNNITDKDNVYSTPLIIATGGGIVKKVQNLALMHRYGTVVYLNVAWDEIRRRLQNVSDRPLALNTDMDNLHRLWRERVPLYQRADIVIETKNFNPQEIAHHVVTQLDQYE